MDDKKKQYQKDYYKKHRLKLRQYHREYYLNKRYNTPRTNIPISHSEKVKKPPEYFIVSFET